MVGCRGVVQLGGLVPGYPKYLGNFPSHFILRFGSNHFLSVLGKAFTESLSLCFFGAQILCRDKHNNILLFENMILYKWKYFINICCTILKFGSLVSAFWQCFGSVVKCKFGFGTQTLNLYNIDIKLKKFHS